MCIIFYLALLSFLKKTGMFPGYLDWNIAGQGALSVFQHSYKHIQVPLLKCNEQRLEAQRRDEDCEGECAAGRQVRESDLGPGVFSIAQPTRDPI